MFVFFVIFCSFVIIILCSYVQWLDGNKAQGARETMGPRTNCRFRVEDPFAYLDMVEQIDALFAQPSTSNMEIAAGYEDPYAIHGAIPDNIMRRVARLLPADDIIAGPATRAAAPDVAAGSQEAADDALKRRRRWLLRARKRLRPSRLTCSMAAAGVDVSAVDLELAADGPTLQGIWDDLNKPFAPVVSFSIYRIQSGIKSRTQSRVNSRT